MASVTVAASRALWLDALKERNKQSVEYVALQEAAGRVLAEDLKARSDIPAFRKSPYDGFVISYGAEDELSRRFRVIGCIGAGEVFAGHVGSGEAVRIMTGAPIPEDCDTMIMQERCQFDGQYITVQGEIHRGENIVPRGEECRQGDTILEAGVLMDGSAIAVAAGLGYDRVPVYKRLNIVLLTSGREVIFPGQPLQAGQIYNSNFFMLSNLLREQGFAVMETYHVSDDPEMLSHEIEVVKRMAVDADVIISTGGVSVGEYDCMPEIYRSLGAKDLYTRIHMRPGAASYGGVIVKTADRDNTVSPTEFKTETIAEATTDDFYTLCFGLSGNPAAAFNGFYLLALPILKHCQGLKTIEAMTMTLPLETDINKHNPFARYVQGQICAGPEGLVFRPNSLLTSSALLGLAHVNGLAKLEQGQHSYKAGQMVQVMLLKMPK